MLALHFIVMQYVLYFIVNYVLKNCRSEIKLGTHVSLAELNTVTEVRNTVSLLGNARQHMLRKTLFWKSAW